MSVIRHAAAIAIEYLVGNGHLRLDLNLQESIKEFNALLRDQRFRALQDIQVEARGGSTVVLKVSGCALHNVSYCVDVVVARRPDVLQILGGIRPCAMAILYAAFLEYAAGGK